MGTPIINHRFTTDYQQPFVVFLIGMRVNRGLQVRKWAWVAAQMGKMLPVLYQHPEKGFLGGDTYFSMFPFTILLVSYWRSFDDLERFARAKDDPHLKSWQEFYQRVGTDGSVGIFHETYMISPGQYEAVYVNTAPLGLVKATGSVVPVTAGHRMKARGRMTGQDVMLKPELELSE
jgi:hypothetical protein